MSYAQLQSPGRIDYIQCNYPTSNRSTPLFGYYSSLCLPRRIMYGFLFFIYCLFRYIPISRVLYIKLGCHARSWLFSPRRWIYMPRTQYFQSHLDICYHTLSPKRRH